MKVRSLCWKDSLEREMATHSIFLLGKFHEQRSLGATVGGLKRAGHDYMAEHMYFHVLNNRISLLTLKE